MNYLFLVSPEYLESMEETYRTAPESLPLTWRFFFDGVEAGRESTASNGHDTEEGWDFELRAVQLIEAYRRYGHYFAQIDPLQKKPARAGVSLEPKDFGLDQAPTGYVFQAAHLIGRSPCGLDTLIQHLKRIYCGTSGFEFFHVERAEERQWLAQKIEEENSPKLAEKQIILKDLVEAAQFEAYIHRAFTGQKRFSLEGGDALIPGLKAMVRTAARTEPSEIVFAMAHRGRLNTLVNVLKKPAEKVMTEFEGNYSYEGVEGGGDVKYHMGYSKDVDVNGRSLHLSLCFNPSHLETVNAVATGIARAKQDTKYQGDRSRVLPILIHGDAAVIGQGVVAETLNLMNLEGYRVGGTVHVVINNQIGFTTDPGDSRSTLYCTDFTKGLGLPVIHVNGEDPEAVVRACELAVLYRQKFQRDIFIDLVCYRKYGHNEGDEPRFTQPQMYQQLSSFKSPAEHYLAKWEGTHSELRQTYTDHVKSYLGELEAAHGKVRGQAPVLPLDWFKGGWSEFKAASETEILSPLESGISEAEFDQIIRTIHQIPEGIQPLPKIQKVLETRWAEFQKTSLCDWAVGEQLAYGSLLKNNFGVRLSGQDSRRGTFSHRHAFLTDTGEGRAAAALTTLASEKAPFHVFNSPLSEYAVMGFDFGYSWAAPKTLTLWEGQFGDFSNGAQIIIDQYLASSENKWRRVSGLVLLLPHGFEGQGPEHSSARLERFLQLCAQGNMQVAYPTTPAQFFHLLRRQMLRNFRKPLIVMTPKSPLRMPEVTSKKAEFLAGGFQNLIVSGAAQASRVFVCSGKVYWDLVKAAQQKKLEKETAFIRLEQLYPLDKGRLLELRRQLPQADWIWVQEEPRNNGAWSYVKLQFLDLDIPLRYVGRNESSSVATGSPRAHQAEQEQFLNAAFATRP